MILIPFYTVLILIILIVGFKNNSIVNNKYNIKILGFLILLCTIYMILIVDTDYTDRYVYTRVFFDIKNVSYKDMFNNYSFEPLFLIITKVISQFINSVEIYYLILYVLFITILFRGLKLIFKESTYLYAFIFFINFDLFYGYVLNGIRQGLAMALIVLALGYFINKNEVKFWFTSIVAILFHYSSAPLIIMLFFLRYKTNVKILIFLYVIMSVLFITGLNATFFNFGSIDYFEVYGSESNKLNYDNSSNLKFYIFNTFFLIIFHFFYKKRKNDQIFTLLFKTYILFSIYFLAFGFIAFSNRIAAYSWFLLPIIFGYLVVKSNNKLFSIICIMLSLFTGIFFEIYLFYLI